jgi:hypothetical protein
MANISSQFKKASELYQRALQQYQAKEKEQLAIINQFKVGDVTIKSKLKPQLIALHKEMQHYQELVDRAENAFERALVSEPIDLGEDTIVKNKKTGNVYSVKNANPAIHTKPSAKDIAHAKAEPKADGMATVNGIASTTGLRAQAVAGWADENGVNLSKVADDLKSKKLKPMDFMTAVVGNPGNKYAKQIISKYSQKAEALEQEVDEVTTNDWHFKKILQMWDKTNSFGKKKIGTVLCRNPRANRNDIIAAMRDSDYKEITHFTDKLHIESVITEKQFKGLEGVPANKSLKDISDAQKIKILQSTGNIIDFIVPKGEKRNFWQVISTGKIAKQNLSNSTVYFLTGKIIPSPSYSSVKELLANVDWKSMEERRRFNEGVIKEDTDTSNIIKDLDKVRHDLIKKVDVLITKKKKLYANVDITTPMSADEKQLDKDIQSIFSQIQSIIQQKRKIKTENVVVEDTGTEADESGMAKGQTKTAIEAATNIQQILDSKGDNFDVPAWVQSYLALASDYLQSINEYYKGNNEN